MIHTEYCHAHIYYSDARTREKAARLRDSLIAKFSDRADVSPMVDRAVGPHPIPMFEADFKSIHYPEIGGFIDLHRDGLSVLLHPVSPDEVRDHTTDAVWLGEKVELNVKFLEDFMAGVVGSVRDGRPMGGE